MSFPAPFLHGIVYFKRESAAIRPDPYKGVHLKPGVHFSLCPTNNSHIGKRNKEILNPVKHKGMQQSKPMFSDMH